MKTIAQQQPGGPEWDSRLFRDLNYIKRKLRYPAGRSVFLPVILAAGILAAAAIIAWSSFTTQAHPGVTPFFIGAAVCIIALMVANRFFRELQFISIATAFDADRNRQLIDQFLKSQHMVVFRHPGEAGVFQIVSRNINPLKEQREVMVFIADDCRILINSHFTDSGFSLAPGARHHRQMAAELKAFVAQNLRN